MGFCFALSDVTVNIQGILLEKHLRHHCLSGLHASYSLGGLGGSILGALFAAIGTTPLITFVLAALLLLCGWCMAAPHVLHSQPVIPHSTTEQTGRKQFSIPPFILICGILAMATFSVEGSCAEWSALLLHTVKGADESTAALGFGAFSITIAFCRLLGDELRQRWGDYALLLRSTVTALLGLCLVLLSPWPLLCLAGYALTGAGLAPIIPVLFSRAGARDDISPQRATTIIATLGYTGLLIIPPCIGWLAQRFGLETALLLPVGLTILLMASSPLFRKPV